MSASDPDSTIYLKDTDNQIKKKIGKAFSGGQDTQELQRKLGGRTKVDVPYQYLTFFLEDDTRLEELRQAYEKGELQSGEMKMAAAQELQSYVKAFRERRQAITPEIRHEFMRPRQLEFKGMPPSKDRKKGLEERRQILTAELSRIDGQLAQLQVSDAN